MKKLTYSEKLKDPRWQKRRLEILNRDGFKCVHCKDEKTTLHVHHLKYHKEPWDASDDDLQVLCEHCHGLIEFMIKRERWQVDFITKIVKIPSDYSIQFYVLLAAGISLFYLGLRPEDEGYIESNYLDSFDFDVIKQLMEECRG